MVVGRVVPCSRTAFVVMGGRADGGRTSVRQFQFWAPQASGAGVSLIMAYLNGNAIPDLLSLRALIAKFSGAPRGTWVRLHVCDATLYKWGQVHLQAHSQDRRHHTWSGNSKGYHQFGNVSRLALLQVSAKVEGFAVLSTSGKCACAVRREPPLNVSRAMTCS